MEMFEEGTQVSHLDLVNILIPDVIDQVPQVPVVSFHRVLTGVTFDHQVVDEIDCNG
jgi:hypothetical protein